MNKHLITILSIILIQCNSGKSTNIIQDSNNFSASIAIDYHDWTKQDSILFKVEYISNFLTDLNLEVVSNNKSQNFTITPSESLIIFEERFLFPIGESISFNIYNKGNVIYSQELFFQIPDFKILLVDENPLKDDDRLYKTLKKNQFENLKKKKELIDIAEQNKDSNDFETTVVLMKDIQNQWKTIGHIPKKESNKLWKQFRQACNYFFDRYHEYKNAGTEEENQSLKDKEVLLESLKTISLSGDQETNISQIKEFSTQWSSLGNVPTGKRQIDNEFYKTLSKFCKEAGMSKEDIDLIKYSSKLTKLATDSRSLNNEISFVRKKINDINSEINQLENNLQFFSNVEEDNPMILKVQKNIETHKINLDQWTRKLNSIKKVID